MAPPSLQLTVHTSLGTVAEPSSVAVEAAELWATDEYAELGHKDFAYSARELAATYADTETSRSVMVLARDRDKLIGLANAQIPDTDNRHLLAVELRIAPDAETAVVLDALWSAISDLIHAESRNTVIVWHASRPSGKALTPKTGAGSVRRSAVTDWLTGRGFQLEQVEVASTLDVVDALTRAMTLESAGAAASAGYDLVSWTGPTPPQLRDALAVQRARMSTDVPMGEVAMEPEVWDAARIAAEDAAVIAMGRSQVWTVAVERTSGDVVAHTLLTCSDESLPEVAYQDDTLVRTDHRGRRLGLRIKAANIRNLARHRPRVRRIHTWNADENEWMLAINRQLGYRPTSTLGCWQLRR